jgi:hypothetical protein
MGKKRRERRERRERRDIEMVVIEPVKECDWVVVDASLCSAKAEHYESKKGGWV